MDKLSEVKEFNIVKLLAKSINGYTYLAYNKNQQNNVEEYYKVLKLKLIEGKIEFMYFLSKS